jgi:D-ribose pyranose/furanose isomerase RbsD
MHSARKACLSNLAVEQGKVVVVERGMPIPRNQNVSGLRFTHGTANLKNPAEDAV